MDLMFFIILGGIIAIPIMAITAMTKAAAPQKKENDRKKSECTVESTGKIVGSYEEHYWDSDGIRTNYVHKVYIEHYYMGKKYRARGTGYYNFLKDIPMNQEVKILVNPNNPEDIYSEEGEIKKDRKTNKIASTIFFLFTVFFLFMVLKVAILFYF